MHSNMFTTNASDFVNSCDTPISWASLMIAMNTLSTIVGALGNILVCITVWKTQSLHSTVNYHMVSLAIADLIVTIIVQPLMVAVLTGRLVGTLACRNTLDTVYRAIGNFSCAASFLNLCLITLERILAVLQPFSTYRNSKSKRFLIALSATWLIPLAYAGLRVFTSRKATSYFSGALFALGYIWMVTCYVVILIFLRIQAKKQEAITVSDRRQRKNERKITLTMIFVIVCFTTMWLPFFYFRLSGDATLNQGFIYELAVTMALCNSSFNPIIYAFRNKKYRNAFKNILRWGGKRKLTTQPTKPLHGSRVNSFNALSSSMLTVSSLGTPPIQRSVKVVPKNILTTNV